MNDFIELLALILSTIAVGLTIIIIIIHIYTKLRRHFSIKVNCWFCNTWIWVPYDSRNCFDCDECGQYNGFNKDGDYNKIIPGQHVISSKIKSNHTRNTSNGLCSWCNNNQQLKVFQLANFVPLNESNYDNEVEHFQKQLEKAYKLCKKCDRVLKTTLINQNARILGQHIQNLGKKGLALLSPLKNTAKTSKLVYISVFIRVILLCIALIMFFSKLFVKLSVFKQFILQYSPANSLTYVDILEEFIVKSWPFNYLKSLSFLKISKYLTSSAIILHSFSFLINRFDSTVKINQFLCWLILFLTTWIKFNKNYFVFIYSMQVFCLFYNLYSIKLYDSLELNGKTTDKSPKTRRKIRKFIKNLETTYSDSEENDSTESLKCETNCSDCSLNSTMTHLNSSYKTSIPDQMNRSIYESLDNLHLDFNVKSQYPTTPMTSPLMGFTTWERPRPILSPSKFSNLFNSGGSVYQMPAQLSRSSSQSSGFESQKDEINCCQPSNPMDYNKDFIVSESTYQPFETNLPNNCLPRFNEAFQPIINNSEMWVLSPNNRLVQPPTYKRANLYKFGSDLLRVNSAPPSNLFVFK